ncbi:MAG: 16S rRNA (guanine(527)-N(7))-methyltransferase RsmG [Sphingobium sp.]
MTEDEARQWLSTKGVPRETLAQLEDYIELLLSEAVRQNLIADSTKEQMWTRHIVDSAQLLEHGPKPDSLHKTWIDLGSGAGLPGLVIAILSQWDVVLIESRRKRIEFLEDVVARLGISNVTVFGGKVEAMHPSSPANVISARAFAPLPRLFAAAQHLADGKTFWLLPKGKSWQSDLDEAKTEWHGKFHVEQSITSPEGAIVIAKSVRRKG